MHRLLSWHSVALILLVWASSSPAQTVAVSRDETPSESTLETRLREAESANRRLAEALDASERRHEEQMRLLIEQVQELRRQVSASPPQTPSAALPRSGEGNIPPPTGPVPTYRSIQPGSSGPGKPLRATFGPGFELASEDGEYQLQFHQETQVDFKEFDPNGDQYARSGIVFPRVRAFFNGRVTKPYEYMVSLNRGFSGLDILDAYVNVNYDKRMQLKVGRFMSPFNYEQFAIQNMWLITPERSLFTANLGLNRMMGAQLWGYLFDERVDYAVAFFDGPRNSFVDYNEAKDVMAFLNTRPFQAQEKGSLLRLLNLGGSFTYGEQDNPLVPRSFRTASNQSNASDADLFSPPFFIFNPDVRERGQRFFWSAHAAWFYKSLSVYADYNGAILRYATDQDARSSVRIPTAGESVALGYFLTGEQLERRTVVDPLHPFNIGGGEFGLGAWELIARYSAMRLDPDVFTQNLADETDWSNRAWITNLGVNWYLNRYLKVYIDWQHTEFGKPVLYRQPDLRQLTNELFWLRVQFYF